MRGLAIASSFALLILVRPSSAAVDCSTFPAASLSRSECEQNIAKAKAAAEVEKMRGQTLGEFVPPRALLKGAPGADSLDLDTLCGSVSQYLGRTVVLREVKFKRLLNLDSGTFGEGSCELLVSGLRRSQGFAVGEFYDIVVSPIGLSK